MEEASCAKAFFTSLLVMGSVSAGAYLCYRLARNLITFCAVFDAPVAKSESLSCEEAEERPVEAD